MGTAQGVKFRLERFEWASPHELEVAGRWSGVEPGRLEGAVRHVHAGEAYLSHTVLDGRYVLRLAVGNMRTTEADVRRAWELLQEL